MRVVFVLFVLAFVGIIVRVTKGSKKRKWLTGGRVQWLLGGYIGLLLICTALSPLLPTQEVSKAKVDSEDIMTEGFKMYGAAIEGRIDQVDSKYLSKKWIFDYHEEQLSITLASASGDYVSDQIIVERKAEDDGRIEAAYYKATSSLNEMDITALVHPIGIDLAGDSLLLLQPKKTELTFYQFEESFLIKQFSGGWNPGRSTNFTDGQSILYLKIPKNLTLLDPSNIQIQYVEKREQGDGSFVPKGQQKNRPFEPL